MTAWPAQPPDLGEAPRQPPPPVHLQESLPSLALPKQRGRLKGPEASGNDVPKAFSRQTSQNKVFGFLQAGAGPAVTWVKRTQVKVFQDSISEFSTKEPLP